MTGRREHVAPRVWTADMIARLTKFWDEGMFLSEIVRRMKVPKPSIQRQVRVLGLPPRPNPTNLKGATKVTTPRSPQPKPLRPGVSTLPPLPSQQETADV